MFRADNSETVEQVKTGQTVVGHYQPTSRPQLRTKPTIWTTREALQQCYMAEVVPRDNVAPTESHK